MSEWTDSETDTLVSMWPTASAAQIAAHLHRPRSAISAKAHRLIRDGVLPAEVKKRYAVRPWPLRARLKPLENQLSIGCQLSARAKTVNDTRAMQPCTLIDLDDGRCHWPLDLGHQVATLFCGGVAERGRRYCARHGRMAQRV